VLCHLLPEDDLNGKGPKIRPRFPRTVPAREAAEAKQPSRRPGHTHTDIDGESKTYEYDPHLDSQLIWAGRTEHTSFDVLTVSLRVHERIDPKAIIKVIRKGGGQIQTSLSEPPDENVQL